MAAAKILQSSINWAAIAERVPRHQLAEYMNFKSRHDAYLLKVLALPENPPAINWEYFKAKVEIPGLVDEFKQKYSAVQVPFPPDTTVGLLAEHEKTVRAEVEAFKVESNARIVEYEKELLYIANLLPFEQMTLEDFKDAYPEDAIDPLNKPTMWPHWPSEQPGYQDPRAAQEKPH